MTNCRFETLSSVFAAVRFAVQTIELHGCDVPSTSDPTSVGSTFGALPRPTREVVGAAFTISNPRARLMPPGCGRFNLAFAVANLIWTMSGEDTPERLSFYTDNASRFLDNSGRFAAAAGKQLFLRDGETTSPIETIVQRLREDTTSRRAVIPLLTLHDVLARPRDTPCTVALQFVLRNERLSMVTFMRSQSAVTILPYDLFLFTSLQELVSLELGADLGDYHHLCGSFHYYHDEIDFVRQICCEKMTHNEIPCSPMARNPIASMRRILDAEADIRLRAINDELITWAYYDVDHYWLNLITSAVACAASRRGLAIRLASDVHFSADIEEFLPKVQRRDG